MDNLRSRSNETGHDGKEHEDTFNGTTKESALPTESVEKQLETENTATSQGTLRPVNVAVGTSKQLGGLTAGDDDEASQSQLCEPSASDDSFSTGTSGLTSGGFTDNRYGAPVHSKKAHKDAVQQSTDATQQVGSSTTSIDKQLELDDVPRPADVTDKETVYVLSPLLGDSQTVNDQPQLHVLSTSGKPLTATGTSIGASDEQSSRQSNNGSVSCLPTSSSTTQQSVSYAEKANNKLETNVNKGSPGARRLIDIGSVSRVDSLQTADDSGLKNSSTDSTKPSPSTGTSTGGVSEEQDIEGSHGSGE